MGQQYYEGRGGTLTHAVSNAVNTGEINNAIVNVMAEYTNAIADAVDKEVVRTANKLKKAIQADSPVSKRDRYKHYKDMWRAKMTSTERGNRSFIIFNEDYKVVHLLEKGHVNRDGSRTEAIPHIAPNEQKYTAEFVEKVEAIIKNGG